MAAHNTLCTAKARESALGVFPANYACDKSEKIIMEILENNGGARMKWHKFSLIHNEAFSDSGESEVQKLFGDIFSKLGNPHDAALFVRDVSKDVIEIFVSPNASRNAIELLRQYSAIGCKKPLKKGLYLFVGQPDAMNVLF